MQFSRMMTTGAALVAAAVTAAVVWSEAGLRGAEPTAGAATTLEGKVDKLLRNDRGDVDGLQLDGDRAVRFPPHVGRLVEKQVPIGSRVKVQGREETRPKGEKVFEADAIESDGTTIKVEKPAAPRPGGPQPPDHEPRLSAQGKVRDFATNPKGDVDGLILEDDTQVRFPPHQGKALQAFVEKGREVRIEGRRHQTPEGAVHLHADAIVDVATGKSLQSEAPAGPRPPAARHGGPAGDRHEEILRELRAIRRLLEDQKK